uniref:Alternative protein IRF2 n=1 Tax=Homo sapiens TaxID=9606 RepID=L8E7Q0_HUMAN|nr:alternative protein IRF2 [Homo sapiens]
MPSGSTECCPYQNGLLRKERNQRQKKKTKLSTSSKNQLSHLWGLVME